MKIGLNLWKFKWGDAWLQRLFRNSQTERWFSEGGGKDLQRENLLKRNEKKKEDEKEEEEEKKKEKEK